LVTALATLALSFHPAPASASIFEFNGAGVDGSMVWDDLFDVSTSNSDCFGSVDCFTTKFSDLLTPLTLVVTGFGPDLFLNDVYLLFSLPAGSVDCTLFAHCGTLSSPDTLASVPTFDQPSDLDKIGASDTDPWAGVRQIIAVDVLSAPVLAADLPGGVITPPPNFLDGLPLALIADSRVGFAVSFNFQPQIDNFVVSIPLAAPAAVPEPTSLLLLGSGLAGAVARRYRRRTNAAA
jgi:hypothetical protein